MGRDVNFVQRAADRVDRERNSGGLCVHHALHDHSHRRVGGDTVVLPIGYCAVVPRGGEADPDGLQDRRQPDATQHRVMLPGEGGLA